MPSDFPRIARVALHGCEIFIRLLSPMQNGCGKSLRNRREFAVCCGIAIAFQLMAEAIATVVENRRWPTQMKLITRRRRPWEING